MSYIFNVLMLFLLLGVIAALHPEGLWNNFLTFVNFFVAALVATNFFEPIAQWLATNYKWGEYFWDLFCFWLLLGGTLLILRMITDSISKLRNRFPKGIDIVGGDIMAALTGWLLICVLCTSLHVGPLPRVIMWGGFRPENDNFFGFAPDRRWLAFVQSLSLGSFSRSAPETSPEAYVFDPEGRFIPMWSTRRAEYDSTTSFSGHDH